MLKVLFVSARNAARGQIAEAILNLKGEGKISACSAGSEPAETVDPYAVEVIREIGADISGNKTKSVAEFSEEPIDFVITLCDKAREQCEGDFKHAVHGAWDIADPKSFKGTEQQKLFQYKKIRNELISRIDLFVSLQLKRLSEQKR